MGLLDFFRSEKRNNNFLRGNFSIGGAANKTAVTTESSMTFSAVFACVRIISESIASLPVRVYRVETDGDKIEEISHPVNRLLTRKPNDFMTTYTFLDVLMNNLLLEGNSYFYIERDSSARPVGLIPIKTEHVKVINHDGQIYYDVKDFELAIQDYKFDFIPPWEQA